LEYGLKCDRRRVVEHKVEERINGDLLRLRPGHYIRAGCQKVQTRRIREPHTRGPREWAVVPFLGTGKKRDLPEVVDDRRGVETLKLLGRNGG
jgi:hypothetical protein